MKSEQQNPRRPHVPPIVMVLVFALVAATIPTQLIPALVRAFPHRATAPHAATGPSVKGVQPAPLHFVSPKPDPAQRAYTAAATTWPAAAVESLSLAGFSTKVRGALTPLWAQSVSAAGPGSLNVRVFDRAAASAAGVSGVLLAVAPGAAGGTGAVRVGLDYAGFAEAYGGNYGSRLRLVQLPPCAVTTPADPVCRRATPLLSTNDPATHSVSAQVTVAASATSDPPASALRDRPVRPIGGVVLAAVSDPGAEGGNGGSYAATDLKPSGTWSGGGSMGSFAYSLPITLPPASSSMVPDVKLAYDSSSVDGQTASTQAQASWVGEGWSTPKSYIEQSFIPCSDSPEGTASPSSTGDMCYDGSILTLSLNGSSTPLVWDSGKSVWKPQGDNGDVITHVTGSGNGSGTYNTDYWTVTERDGTAYSFGLNHLPGWSSGNAATNSVDSQPVFSAHSGDPCYSAAGFSASVCTMAYRWNLDYTKDLHGNAMSYFYKQDTNFYGQSNGASNVSYVRDSYLDHIDYGFTDGNAYATVPDKVLFGIGDRCLSGTCQPLNPANKANWPDVPFDLMCASGMTCSSWGPAYFSTVRLASITTEQYSTTASTYLPVDTYALTQTIPPTGDGTSPTLWLSSFTRTGSDTTAGGSTAPIAMPPIQFGSVQLANRVDTAGGLPAFYKYRLATITTETGSVITANYGRPDPCTAPVTITASANTSSCYPVSWTPVGFSAPITDWFNKYVVTMVTATDPTGGAPTLNTSYQYAGGAAWHYDDNEVVQPKYRTYGQFRGYGDVKTVTGDGVNDRQALAEATYYRGMSKNNNSTVANVTDSVGGVHEDVNDLAGRQLESISYLGNGGPVDHSDITHYWVSQPTATRTRTGLSPLTAAFVAVAETYDRQALTASGTTTWQNTEADITYDATITDANVGLPLRTYKHTVPVNSAYDQCTSVAYAPPNTTRNLVGLVAETEQDTVGCNGFTPGSSPSVPSALNTLTAPTPNRPAQVASDERTFYDDPTWSTTFPQAAPTKGDVTMTRKAADYTAGAFAYQTTARKTFDSLGRPLDSYDGNGNKSTTAYAMNQVGLTTGSGLTNPLGQTSSSTMDTLRGLILTETDPNSVVATQQYDALGRVTGVWTASRATSSAATFLFSYQISNTGITAVTTQKLNESSGYQTSTLIYDALLRPRQTQTLTPQSGRLIVDTYYDSRGWTRAKYNGWWDPATLPNTTLVTATNLGAQVPNEDFYTYDGLGRTVYDASEQNGLPVAATTTVYNGDRTTVVPPLGGVTKATITDPMGRTKEVDQYKVAPTLHTPGDVFTGVFTLTGGSTIPVSYGFDGHGQPSVVTDPAGTTWTSTFNLLGQATAKADPDAGTTTGLTYDGDGNLTQSTDSRSKTISYTYDQLDRRTGQFASAVAAQSTSNQTAKWVYDNSDNAVAGMTDPIGHVTKSTAFSGGAAYVVQKKGFDAFGNDLGETVTIPSATEGSVLGTAYTISHTYSPITGVLLTDKYPLKGGLPLETVNHTYAGVLDLPDTVGGAAGYAEATTYDAWSRVNQETVGAAPNRAYLTYTYDAHTGKMTDRLVTRSTATPSNVDDQAYSYDLVGNVTKQVSTRLGSTATAETQCYTYDPIVRMTAAWTATDGCATVPTGGSHAMVGDNLSANSAYWTSWTVDDIGDRTQQIQHGTGGGSDTTTGYAYNGNGSGQPHVLTSTTSTGGSPGTTGYGYDTAGNMTTRNAGQGAQTLGWNDLGQLTTVTGSTSGSSSFVYDADGNLLLQKDPTTTTLYLPGEQIKLTLATGVASGVRYYPLPGGGTAVRTGSSTNYSFELTDPHATADVLLDSTAQTPTWRQFTPYGGPRGTAVSWLDNRAFLNKPVDTATGLTEVGARNYDPTTGRFVSLDPQFERAVQQSLNGYLYANNNPLTFSDPSGEGWGTFWKVVAVVAVVVVVVAVVVVAGPAIVAAAPLLAEMGTAFVAAGGAAVEAGASAGVAATIGGVAAAGEAAAAGGAVLATAGGAVAAAGGAIAVGGKVVSGILGGGGTDEPAGGRGRDDEPVEPDGAPPAGGGKGSCNSFDPATPVLMADGTSKPIRDVKLGEKVLAADPGSGKSAPEPVTQLYDNQDSDLADVNVLNTASGQISTVHTTWHHPFWDESSKSWEDAAELAPGARLHSAAATLSGPATLVVVSVHTWTGEQQMLNLTVDQLHTYYVLIGGAPVLVHNRLAPDDPTGGSYPIPLPTQKTRGRTQRLTNAEATELAEYNGYRPTNEKVKNQTVFTNGKDYIVQDIDSHNGGTWKIASSVKKLRSKDTRTATTDALLNEIGC